MKWLSVENDLHWKRDWHPMGFAWRPFKIDTVTYWLEKPPYDQKLVRYNHPRDRERGGRPASQNEVYDGYWQWEYRPHPIKD